MLAGLAPILIRRFAALDGGTTAADLEESLTLVPDPDLGHRLINSQPDACGGELDEGEVVCGVFFEARRDRSEVLQLVEEALDEVL